ncbi:hypothetical protein ACWCPS_20755 [Streptomyces mauvecolor]
MSAITDTMPAPRARGGIGGSVRDSLVVAKRNLIRMTRIPNPVRGTSIRFSSRSLHGQRMNDGKGWEK